MDSTSKLKQRKLRDRKCKVCKTKFTPHQPFQAWCTPDCAYKWQRILKEKKERKDDNEARVKRMTHGDYIQLFQAVFNTFIRLRDRHEPCISCGTRNTVKYDAGHFWAAGNYTYLRFNEDNVHKQCSNLCNKHLSGNPLEYRYNLIRRIGAERVQKLDDDRYITSKKSIPELQEMIEAYRLKIKELKLTIKEEE
jgi:hypothetical protein